LKKDLFINITITFLIGLLTFLINRAFSDALGQETLGLMNLMNNLIAYLNVANLGIATASTYALYKPFAQKDYKKISIIVSTIDSYYKKIALFIVIVGSLLVFYIQKVSIELSFESKEIAFYWFLYLFNTAFTYFYTKYSVIFLANQEYGFNRLVEGGSRVFIMFLQLIALKITASFLIFILLFSLKNIITFTLYKIHFNKYYSFIKKTTKKEPSIFKNMKNLFWHKLGEIVVFNTDNILLASYTSLKVVAIYSSYTIITQMVLMIVGILTPVLAQRVGKFIATSTKEAIYNYWKRLHSFYIYMATILTLIAFYTINSFMKLWMGEAYLVSSFTILLILMNLYILIARAMIEVFKNGCGFYSDIYNPILESILNLIISFTLVQKMGLDGVLIGTVVSNLLIIYILKPLMVFKRCFSKEIKDYIRDFCYYTFLSAIAILISIFLIRFINLEVVTWFDFLKLLFKIGVIVIGVTTGAFIFDKSFKELLNKGFVNENN